MEVTTYTCYIEQEGTVDLPVKKLVHTDDVGRIAEALGYTRFAEETLGMLCVNHQNEVTAYHELARGTVCSASTQIINIIKRAALSNTDLIVLFHNHPMGSLQPSKADMKSFEDIRQACLIVGIVVMDEVVIAGDGRTDHTDFSEIAKSITMAIKEKEEREAEKRRTKEKDDCAGREGE